MRGMGVVLGLLCYDLVLLLGRSLVVRPWWKWVDNDMKGRTGTCVQSLPKKS